MPVYTMHVRDLDLSGQKRFANAMIALHAETFGTNPAAVRVEFVLAPCENTRFRYGGLGFSPAKGFMGVDSATEYMVAQLDFRGSAQEWQDYCRKIVRLRGRALRSIYLQRLEFEFEVEEERSLGKVVVNNNNSHHREDKDLLSSPPSYMASLK